MTKPAKPADADARSLLDRMAAARQAEQDALGALPDPALAEAFGAILANEHLTRARADLKALAEAMSDPRQRQAYGAIAAMYGSAWAGFARLQTNIARAAASTATPSPASEA